MSTAGRVLKRLLVGQPFTNDKLGDTLLPKRIALPVFASDALSSVAYAPDEIFITLSVAGLSAYAFSWKVGLAVAVVMLTIVASYRQNVHAYPSGGGDYEVATTNIGSFAGLTVASALLVDYVLTVAVSVSSGVQNATSALPFLNGHESTVATALVLLLMAMNLRGIRESGSTFAVPTYCFMVSIIGMVIWGLLRQAFGDLPHVDSARFTISSDPSFAHGLGSAVGAFLILRTFSSGCAALTGVEAISNGVPAFKKPKSKNAATTLLLMGTIAVTMLIGIITLANLAHLRYVDPDVDMDRLMLGGKHLVQAGSGAAKLPGGGEYDQQTVIGQLAHAVFSNFSPAFYFTIAATGIILILAANTAFNGFPVLASILARDGFLPRQLHTRGDRLAFSNGIVILAGAAIVLIIAFNAQPTRLIQLYIVGVFVSFTTSQIGMIRHWNRLLKTEKDRRARARMQRSRTINGVGAVMSGTVLVVVLITKFAKGAWIAIAAMAVLFVMMRGIQRHYARVQIELQPDETVDEGVLPSRVHAIVLVSKIHKPTLRALVYARATRPSILEAVTVNVETDATKALQAEWKRRDLPVPLKILDSPYREITRPILDYVKSIRRGNPRDVVMVYIPEYIVGHWWEQLLHNQSALRLKGRLLFTPGVMVASVPWQLSSTEHLKTQTVPVRSGTTHRGAAGAGSETIGEHPVAPEVPSADHGDPAEQPLSGPIGDDSTPKLPELSRVSEPPGSLRGSIVDLEVGPVAHGGHCVARLDGRVVFVRHALPGELVRARITEGGETSRFLRADAVEALRPSPDRVPPACPVAGAGGCGGCDWQHATPAAQRDLKTAVVREQLARLAGLVGGVADVTVEELPGRADGLGWRTRVQHGVDDQFRLGFRRHRSHDIVPVEQCPITHPNAAAAGHLAQRWPGSATVEVAAPEGEDHRLVVVTPASGATRRTKIPPVAASVAVTAPDGAPATPLTRVRGRTWVREVVRVGDWRHEFRVTGTGFWQVHPAAAATLAGTVLDQLDPHPGERALDLYCGVGLFAAALADRVGPRGAVAAVEGDSRAVADARRNLHGWPTVSLHHGPVARVLPTALEALPSGRADIVVLDPPRVGAGRAVVEALCAAGPRAICYVACDPAALARDLRTASGLGYQLTALRAFDAFPMTHHVECVALLTRPA